MRFAPLLVLLSACASDSRKHAPESPNAQQAAAESVSVEVVPLQYATAQELAATLSQLLWNGAPAPSLLAGSAEARVVADSRTNSVIVRASAKDMPRILDLIRQLDRKVEKK